MELSGSRILVAGASGALGRLLTPRLVEAGARVVVGGRDPGRLQDLADNAGTDPVVFDVVDTGACSRAVAEAADQLGGLDAVLVTVGVAGFGRAVDFDDAVAEELFAVNALGPMALVRAAAHRLADGGCIAVISAVLADLPTAGMADYSAAKSALSVWLGVLRREERRRLRVLDIRPPHLDTGLETRALAGEPPRLPEPMPARAVVDTVLEALAADATEVVMDRAGGGLTTKR